MTTTPNRLESAARTVRAVRKLDDIERARRLDLEAKFADKRSAILDAVPDDVRALALAELAEPEADEVGGGP